MTKQEEFEAAFDLLLDITAVRRVASDSDKSIPLIQKSIRLYFEIDRELNQHPLFITNRHAKGDDQMSGLAVFMTVTELALQFEKSGPFPEIINDYTRSYYNAVLKLFP